MDFAPNNAPPPAPAAAPPHVPEPSPVRQPGQPRPTINQLFAQYFWLIVKNVVGWVFIIGSLPVGLTLPGPFGLPLFLIGFVLVSFPGKRPITTRVMSGRPMRVGPGLFGVLLVFVSVLVSTLLIWLLQTRYEHMLQRLHLNIEFHKIKPGAVVGIVCLSMCAAWLVLRLAAPFINFLLRRVPQARRFMRPWLRRRGITLLPPRYRPRRKLPTSTRRPRNPALPPLAPPVGPAVLRPNSDQTIVAFSPRLRNRANRVWNFFVGRPLAFAAAVWNFLAHRKPRPSIKRDG